MVRSMLKLSRGEGQLIAAMLLRDHGFLRDQRDVENGVVHKKQSDLVKSHLN